MKKLTLALLGASLVLGSTPVLAEDSVSRSDPQAETQKTQTKSTPVLESRAYTGSTHPMYRLYNPNTGEHFYTAFQNERATLINGGWSDEGTAWNAPDEGWFVYRLYNPNEGDHHYTSDEDEKNTLLNLGWRDEGVGWASPSLGWEDPKTATGYPIYRLYNPYSTTASHHYTANAAEANSLIRLGWRYEGIGWYGL